MNANLLLYRLAQTQHADEWDGLSGPLRRACLAEQLLQLVYSSEGEAFAQVRTLIDTFLRTEDETP